MTLRNILYACFTSFCLVAASTEVFASDAPSFDLESNGNGASAWYTYNADGLLITQANTYLNGAWSTSPTTLSSGAVSNSAPKISVITNGNDISAVAIWGQTNEAGYLTLFAAMLVDTNTGWTTPAQLSSGVENVVGAAQYFIRLTPSGQAVALWTSYDDFGNEYVRSASSQIDGTNSWSSPVYVSAP